MERNIKIPQLDEHSRICEILNKNGKECYIVGGAVRDSLLGKEPNDIDFTTDATPDEIRKIFEKENCKVYPTGEKFGTMTVTCDFVNYYEVTTYRGETYKRYSRKPEVYFSKYLIEDLKRRDFTINAMAYDPIKHKLVDPFNGYEDLKNKIIRAVGNPTKRFSEDPLRLLRMCRFKSYLNGKIDTETEKVAIEMKDELRWIPKERIRDELIKGLTKGEAPSVFVECIVDTRLNDYVVPELYELRGLEQPKKYHKYDAYVHTLKTLDATPNDYELRLSALFHDLGKSKTIEEKNGRIMFPGHAEVSAIITEKIMTRLRFSNKEKRRVANLVRYHMHPLTKYVKENPNLMMDLVVHLTNAGADMDLIDKLEELSIADVIATGININERVKEVKDFFKTLRKVMEERPLTYKELKINGTILMEEFGISGKIVGDTLEYLLKKVWKNPELNNREKLLQIAYNYIKSRGYLKKKYVTC